MKTINALTGTQTTDATTGLLTQPVKQITIENPATGNPSFSRAVQINTQYVLFKYGIYSVGFALSDLAILAVAYEPNLTYPPLITTQPINATCVHASTAATFTVAAASELAKTYLWQYYDGAAWQTASGTVAGCVYTGGTTVTLTCTPTTTGQTGKQHRCIVTNALSSTTSSVAVLTIT